MNRPTILPRVLVVDDEPLICKLISEFLTAQGYEVFTSLDAAEAMRIIRLARPRFVLLDIRLVNDNGLLLLDQIHLHDPKALILMITAVADEAIAHEALRRGAVDYLIKPIDLEYLMNSLKTKCDAVSQGKA